LNVSGVCFLHCLLILNPSHPHPQRGRHTDTGRTPSWYLCVGTYPKDDRAWTGLEEPYSLYCIVCPCMPLYALVCPATEPAKGESRDCDLGQRHEAARCAIYDRYMMRDGIAHICSTLTLSGASGQGQVGEHTGGRGTRNNATCCYHIMSKLRISPVAHLSLCCRARPTTDHRPVQDMMCDVERVPQCYGSEVTRSWRCY
jgi:hypothetical protein